MPGKTLEVECVRWYRWIKQHPLFSATLRRRLGSTPIFRDDDAVLPLKAADMHAWHLRRHLNEEQPKKIPAGEYLNSVSEMFWVSCILRPQDLASLAYSIKTGLMFQAKCGYFLARDEEERGKLLS